MQIHIHLVKLRKLKDMPPTHTEPPVTWVESTWLPQGIEQGLWLETVGGCGKSCGLGIRLDFMQASTINCCESGVLLPL